MPTLPTIPISKQTLIKWMPALALLLTGGAFFLSVELGVKAMIGYGLGLAGRALFPYWIKWKENAEELKFNYSYLVPIVIGALIGVLVGMSGFPDYLTLVAAQEGWNAYWIYLGALFVGYFGADGINKVKGLRDFLNSLWEASQALGEIVPPVPEPVEETPVLPKTPPPVVDGTE